MTRTVRLLFLIALLALPQFLLAQTADSTAAASSPSGSEKPAKPKRTGSYKLGVWANVLSGATIAGFGDLKKDLAGGQGATGKPFSADFRPPLGGSAYFGGGLHVLFAKRVILGFQAQGFYYHTAEDSIGQARINSSLFSGMIGYAAINRPRWLLYPYVGIGGGSYQMFLKNYSASTIYFGDNGAADRDFINNINRTSRRTFTASHFDMEVGVSTRHFLMERGHVMLGVDMGAYFRVAGSNWGASNGTEVANVSAPNISGGYLRFSIGGGIFWWAPGQKGTAKAPKEMKPKREKRKPAEESGESPSEGGTSEGGSQSEKKKSSETDQ
jgi:hypothetical protein